MTLFELNKPKHIEKEYLESMKDGLIDRIINGKIKGKSRVLLSDSMKSILIPNYNGGQPDYSRVETLLIGEPSRLFQLNNQIKGEINQINLVKDRPSDSDLEVIFDYDGIFNSTSKSKLNNYFEKRNLNKFSLLKLKKSKSTNNLINIKRWFSINDIHTNDNKIGYNYNSINKFKSSNHNKNINYNINNKINYFEPIMNNPYKTFINNKTIKNDIYSMDSIINNNLFSFKETINRSNIKINSTIIYKHNNFKNTFRIRNNYENNNKKYITNISKSNFIRYNLLNKRKKINN